MTLDQDDKPKPVKFIGRSLDELRDFPDDAKQDAGYHIHLVQVGATPPSSKPMPNIGQGVREIRITANDGWFRVFYVAELEGKVCILHAFQKKSNTTPKNAITTGQQRYKTAVLEA
ncbi:type II toxin-antitoxin system RelE/ParE family toxin [Nocardia sp. NPDC055321]